MKGKRIILFIVEGISDQDALGYLLSEVIDSSRVEFFIVGGDITSDHNTTVANAFIKVNNIIKKFLSKNRWAKKSDIELIVQLTDTDGVYIGNQYIIYQSNLCTTEYYPDSIRTSNVNNIIDRNERKANILNKLAFKKKLNGINYQVYYFSVNLEHVLHNLCNVDENDKMNLAYDFAMKFLNKKGEFLQFMKDRNRSQTTDYNDSWKFIQDNRNSLMRASNLYIFLQNYV